MLRIPKGRGLGLQYSSLKRVGLQATKQQGSLATVCWYILFAVLLGPGPLYSCVTAIYQWVQLKFVYNFGMYLQVHSFHVFRQQYRPKTLDVLQWKACAAVSIWSVNTRNCRQILTSASFKLSLRHSRRFRDSQPFSSPVLFSTGHPQKRSARKLRACS